MSRTTFSIFVFVVWLLSFISIAEIMNIPLLSTLRSMSPLYFLAAIFIYLGAISCGIGALMLSLRNTGIKVGVKGLAKAWIFGSFVDNMSPTITPFGEAVMGYFLKKFYGVPYSKGMAAIGAYVTSWGVSVTIFSTVSLILAHILFPGISKVPGATLFSVLIVLVFSSITLGSILVFMKKRFIERIANIVVALYIRLKQIIKKREIPKTKYTSEFENFYERTKSMVKNRRIISINVVIFFGSQFAHGLALWTIIRGFGINVPFIAVLFIHIVSSVSGLISFIPSGFGVYEISSSGLIVTLFEGVPSGVAVAIVFVYRFIFVWFTNFIGGIIGLMQGIKSSEIDKSVKLMNG